MRLEKHREQNGILVKTENTNEFFDEKAEVEAEKILSSRDEKSADKNLLSRLLWNQSV